MADNEPKVTTTTTSAGSVTVVKELPRFQQEVRDAVELMDFAVESGRNVSDSIIERIEKAENYLNSSQWPTDDQRGDFEKAYRDLAMFMKPITINTLRATTEYPDTSNSGWRRLFNRMTFRTTSAAKRYSKTFWVLVIVCLAVIVTTEGLKRAFADPDPKDTAAVAKVNESRKPFPRFAGI